tara:strand:- start:2133 stop:4526 length:2394 start_codon:yes stop_codon:yes gene_type:complete
MSKFSGKEGRTLQLSIIEEIQKLRKGQPPKKNLSDVSLEEFLRISLVKGGKGGDPDSNTGMITHIKEWLETQPRSPDGFVQSYKTVLDKPAAEFFLSDKFDDFHKYVMLQDYKYDGKYQRIGEVAKVFNQIVDDVDITKETPKFPLRSIQDKQDKSPTNERLKSTPFLETDGSGRYNMKKLDLTLDKFKTELTRLDTAILSGVDSQTGDKIEDIGALKQRRDLLHAGRAMLLLQLVTGHRGGETLSLQIFDDKATEAWNVDKEKINVSDPTKSYKNTNYSTFRKQKLTDGTFKYSLYLPNTVTKETVSFSAEISPKLGVILDKQAQRVQTYVKNENDSPSRSLFAIGNYSKNGKFKNVQEAYDYGKEKPSERPSNTLKKFLFGQNGFLAQSDISFNPSAVEGGASQDFFVDHDLRSAMTSYTRGNKTEILKRMMAYDASLRDINFGLKDVDDLISYSMGRESIGGTPVEQAKSGKTKRASRVTYDIRGVTPYFEQENYGVLSRAITDMLLNDSQSFQNFLYTDVLQGENFNNYRGYSFNTDYKPSKYTPQADSFNNTEYKISNNTSVSTEILNDFDEFDELANQYDKYSNENGSLNYEDSKEYDEIEKTQGKESAEKFKNNKVSFLGAGALFDEISDFGSSVKEAVTSPSFGKTASAVGKSLPLVGPIVGTALGVYYGSKPLEEYIVEGDETEEELTQARKTRAFSEVASGFNPIPEPAALNILNVLPGEQNLNIISAAEAISPTGEEAQQRQESGYFLKNTEKDKKPISIEKSNGNGLYEQMLGLMSKDQQSPQSM